MRIPFRRRLAFVQTRNFLLIAVLLVLATTGNQIRADLEQARLESGSSIAQILDMQQGPAAQAAWNLDRELAAGVLRGLFFSNPVSEAAIISDTGETLAHGKRQENRPATTQWLADKVIDTTSYTRQLVIPGKDKSIGTLTVTIDSTVLAKPFLDRTRRNVLHAVIPLTVLACLLLLLLYFKLTRPLVELSARLTDIDTAEPLRSPLPRPPSHEHDELGLVVTTINRLLQQFDDLLQRMKAAESDLLAAEQKYRSIFDNALEGIYQTTLEGRFISANPFLARILGYASPDEMIAAIDNIGNQLYADPARREEFLQLLMRDGQVRGFEARFHSRDGSFLWGSQSARIVRDDAGRPLFIEGAVSDITLAKRAAEDMARLEAQLMQAQKMEALGNLTGGIAHDFNNLLQIISGSVQLLLLNRDEGHPDHKQLSNISQAATRASDLIRRMLTFSRKVEVKKSPVDLNGLIRNILTLLERTIPRMVVIRTVLAPDLAAISADPSQMEQVIMNLANNAAQAMDGSGLMIIETDNFPVRERYSSASFVLDPGDYVMMKVTDNGPGMDESTRLRIFEPFFTTKGPGKGTGLGLASVYGIVTGHGGQITCYSEPGVGTSFLIFLPALQTGMLPPQHAPEIDRLIGGDETILLIDDEQAILAIAHAVLAQHGYHLFTARTAEEGLEIYHHQRGRIDLVILDLGMAGMGGIKCLETIRSLDPQARVIVASGYAGHEIAADPGRYGAAAFLAKPYPLNRLVTLARNVLDR